jgi:hypothetical protein
MKFWEAEERKKSIGTWNKMERLKDGRVEKLVLFYFEIIMPISKFRKYLGFVLHVVFFVVMISSIFRLHWYRVLLVFALLRIQDFIFGGCILTRLEFWDFRRQWIKYHYIKMSKFPTKYFAVWFDRLFPLVLVLLAYCIQR